MQPAAVSHNIPTEVQRVAKTQRLGMLRRVYATKKEPLLFRMLGTTAILLGIFIIFAYLLTYTTLFLWLPIWQALLIPIIGFGWLVVGSWIVFTTLIGRRIRVFIYDDGLIYTRPRPAVIRRDQIETLWKNVQAHDRGHINRTYTVRLNSNAIYTFHHTLIDVQELGNIFEQELLRRHLSKAVATYKLGTPVSFDVIIIDQLGITVQIKNDKQQVLWHDIEHIAIKETGISIYTQRTAAPWRHLPGATIPNLVVLKGLLYEIRRAQIRYARDPQAQLIATYQAGLPLTFGHLTISTKGIIIDGDKKEFRWSEVASIGIGEEEVIIRLKGASMDWYVVPAWMITDITALKGLIGHIMRKKTS